MVICSKHGGQIMMNVSPDLAIGATFPVTEFIRIHYYLTGENWSECILIATVSTTFAESQGVELTGESEIHRLEEPPDWTLSLVGACAKCFEEEHNGRLIDLKWHSK